MRQLFALLFTSLSLFAGFCEEIFEDLYHIIEKTESIPGHLKEVKPFPGQGGSFINEIFLVITDDGESYVLKVENPNWENEKTLNEVRSLIYLKDSSIPVPEVLAFEQSLSSSNINREYILMRRCEGKPLNHEFERVYADKALYKEVLSQLADVVIELKTLQFDSIGSFCDNFKSLKCPLDFAATKRAEDCKDFAEYATVWLCYYRDEMKALSLKNHKNTHLFKEALPKIEALLEADLTKLNDYEDKFFFSHQDFVMKNILINDRTISAVLDWEWSGSAPREFESMTGFDFLKTEEDKKLFNLILESKGHYHLFDPSSNNRRIFYAMMGDLYNLISCYEWIEGKLIHSAKFLSQKLEQRRVKNSRNIDMSSYSKEAYASFKRNFNQIYKELT